jgi:hypothetical protein
MACPFAVAEDFEIVPNDPSDQASKIQTYLNSVDHGGICWLPKGKYIASTFYLPYGVRFWGVGVAPNATVIEQPADYDGDLITSDPSLSTNAWEHWGEIAYMRIQKQTGGLATVGNGIHFNTGIGENMKCHDLLIRDFPQSGLKFAQGGTPVWIHDIHGFDNGAYLIDLSKPGNRRMQITSIQRISGDNNKLGTIYISTVGDKSEDIYIEHVKCEASKAGRQLCVVHLDKVNNLGVHVKHIGGFTTSAAVPTLEGIVKLTGSFQGSRLYYQGHIPGYPYAVRDYTTSAAPLLQPERGETISYQTSGVVIERW